jgi:pyridoxal phosphate enzyme (YggS family)
MSTIAEQLVRIKQQLPPHVTLVAVSKTHPTEKIKEAYEAGQRVFGENRVQELIPKLESLSADIQWHLIGTLQKNKAKYVVGKVALIHSIDTFELLQTIEKEAQKKQVVQSILLQVHIAQEETKHGFDASEIENLLSNWESVAHPHIQICGLMGMATFTDNTDQVKQEFSSLRELFNKIRSTSPALAEHFQTLSMGMSGDYALAIAEGSTMIRVGSAIFGSR